MAGQADGDETAVDDAVVGGVTRQRLAALFDCTVRQIELWANEGLVVRVGRGRYDEDQSTTNLIRHLRQQAAGRAGVDPNTDVASANKAKSEEAAALTRTKRMQLEGTLVAVDAVREQWSRILRNVRQAIMAMPGAIAFEVPSLTPHDLKAIKRIAVDTLTDLSLGAPPRHMKVADGEGDADELDGPIPDRATGGRSAEDAGAAAAGLVGGLG